MVQKIAQDGYLVVTWANWHYQDFVNTWVKHVQGVGITGYIVGAMDDHLLQVCVSVLGHFLCGVGYVEATGHGHCELGPTCACNALMQHTSTTGNGHTICSRSLATHMHAS